MILYVLSYWDLGWEIESNYLFDNKEKIIKKLIEAGFTLDYEDEDGIFFIRNEGGYGDQAQIMKLVYEETKV